MLFQASRVALTLWERVETTVLAAAMISVETLGCKSLHVRAQIVSWDFVENAVQASWIRGGANNAWSAALIQQEQPRLLYARGFALKEKGWCTSLEKEGGADGGGNGGGSNGAALDGCTREVCGAGEG